MTSSVIVAGGDVKVSFAISTVIVCDGDVEFDEGVGRSLIIARGKVTSPRLPLMCVVRSEDFLLRPDGKKVVLKDGVPDPFRFVKFFEPSDVGLTVAEQDAQGKAARDGVCVREVRKGTPFSPALQAGDVITALDGIKAGSKEVFRKLLRRQLARGGPRMTFTIVRSGQTVSVPVSVKD
jgi:hypothetical protein